MLKEICPGQMRFMTTHTFDDEVQFVAEISERFQITALVKMLYIRQASWDFADNYVPIALPHGTGFVVQ